ncbi:MAG TPA: hypothetical protein DFR83_28595, partial [Deltaproteobacteria bacterium]|nr:hypothetical protein [Deltaproteobacteria bacterium]
MKTTPLAAIVALSSLALTNEAAAVPVTVQLTADNAYAIYTGSGSTVTDHWATEFNSLAGQIATPETYSFTMNDDDVIYVVAWSDDATHQGLLAEFDIGGTIVTTSSTHWEVMATGIDLDVGDPAPTIDNLTTQVQLGDAGGGASGGWVTPELGDLNDGSALVDVPAMASYVQWAWYRSAETASGDTTFLPGANHDEYLIFRMKFPMEGCCLGDECFNTDPDDCMSLGGIPLGDELLCEDFAGECVDLIEEAGACCTKDECVELSREACLEEEGTYLGDEVSCDDVDVDCTVEEPPETGACCVDGECVEMEHDKCLEQGGEFAGVGVTCDDIVGECDEPVSDDGACCTDDMCEVIDRVTCEEGGGVFWGVGTDCDSADIECPADDG